MEEVYINGISLLCMGKCARIPSPVTVMEAPGTPVYCATNSVVFPTESISLTQDRNSLCTSIVLICSFDNLHFVRFEEFVTEGFGFSTLTTNYISSNPDYEEIVSDGLYKLRITRAERYNGTRYRCHGFVGDLSEAFHSDEWQLVVPRKLN